MIEILIRQSLGTAGSGLLDFYRANNVWINLLILSYAAVFFIGRFNYNKIQGAALEQLKQALNGKEASLSLITRLMRNPGLDFDAALAASRLPWVSYPGKAYPVHLKPEQMLAFLTPQRLFQALQPAPDPFKPPQA